MKTSIIALCALPGLCACLYAADNSPAPLAIYYSFDSAPPRTTFSAIQAELARILAPARLQVAWRPIPAGSAANESFPEIVVLHFRGECLFLPAAAAERPVSVGATLADTDLVDGRILPFGDVQCDELRRFIAPIAASLKPDRANAALGRAIARVGAHEIYHMLTGSMAHARSGIARAAHSRVDLTEASFTFAPPQEEWLRGWVAKLKPHQGSTPLDIAGLSAWRSAGAATSALLTHP